MYMYAYHISVCYKPVESTLDLRVSDQGAWQWGIAEMLKILVFQNLRSNCSDWFCSTDRSCTCRLHMCMLMTYTHR